MNALHKLLRRRRRASAASIAPAAPIASAREQRAHAASDWADAGLGPNRPLRDHERHSRDERVLVHAPFVIDERVAQRFNAYARAAHPREIGGLLRVQEQADGSLRVTDVRIFPHVAASGGYFELDGAAVAAWSMQLALAGRKDEIPQWCSLIHSHPNMQPFLSGTDRENIKRLAGRGRAFSVIVATSANPDENRHALHYAQGGPVALVARYLPVSADEGATLSGTAALTEAELDAIADEVTAAMRTVRSRY